MTEKLNMALIYGSTREGRFCDTVAGWAARRIENDPRFEMDVIDPLALRLPTRFGAPDDDGAVAELRRRLDRADAFTVVTPEYNHSYPAALKSTIDMAKHEWQSKPVGFVSYGGMAGGLRAVEHLRLVFAELHSVTLRDTVSIANPWSRFDADGELTDPREPETAMARLLAHAAWWAGALKNARASHPYHRIAA